MTRLPRWKCHKVVEAVKIESIARDQPQNWTGLICKGSYSLGTACGMCERCVWEKAHPVGIGGTIFPVDKDVAPFFVHFDYLKRHDPMPGGYYVRYEDGYEAFSPAKAFEDGYTREEPNALQLGAEVRALGLQGS